MNRDLYVFLAYGVFFCLLGVLAIGAFLKKKKA